MRLRDAEFGANGEPCTSISLKPNSARTASIRSGRVPSRSSTSTRSDLRRGSSERAAGAFEDLASSPSTSILIWVGKGGAKRAMKVIDSEKKGGLSSGARPCLLDARHGGAGLIVGDGQRAEPRAVGEGEPVGRNAIVEAIETDIVAKQRVVERGGLEGENLDAFTTAA